MIKTSDINRPRCVKVDLLKISMPQEAGRAHQATFRVLRFMCCRKLLLARKKYFKEF